MSDENDKGEEELEAAVEAQPEAAVEAQPDAAIEAQPEAAVEAQPEEVLEPAPAEKPEPISGDESGEDEEDEEDEEEEDLFDDDDDGAGSGEESTSFDDVALSLLLFFMVTSLFGTIQSSSSSASGSSASKLPAIGGFIDLAKNEFNKIDLDLDVDEEEQTAQVVLRHSPKDGQAKEAEITMDLGEARGAKLRNALVDLVKRVETEPVEDVLDFGIVLTARLPKDLQYRYAVNFWYALAKLGKHPAFKARVAMVVWGSGSEAKKQLNE